MITYVDSSAQPQKLQVYREPVHITRKFIMGQLISSFLSGGNATEEVKESVEILQKLVSTKLQAYAEEMEAKAFEDKSLPICAVVDKTEMYTVKVKKDPSKEVQDTLGHLFKGKFLDGLKDLVTAALNELLGNAAAGEKEKRGFHVIFAQNGLCRVDYHMYKYDFKSKGLREKVENALCFVVQMSVLDINKVDPQVVLYELDKTVGKSNIQHAIEELNEDGKYMEDLYDLLKRLRVAKDGTGNGEKN